MYVCMDMYTYLYVYTPASLSLCRFSKRLDTGQSSFDTVQAGTMGWRGVCMRVHTIYRCIHVYIGAGGNDGMAVTRAAAEAAVHQGG